MVKKNIYKYIVKLKYRKEVILTAKNICFLSKPWLHNFANMEESI